MLAGAHSMKLARLCSRMWRRLLCTWDGSISPCDQRSSFKGRLPRKRGREPLCARLPLALTRQVYARLQLAGTAAADKHSWTECRACCPALNRERKPHHSCCLKA